MEERTDRPVHHPRVPIADVRIGPGDDVAVRLVERLPERLPLAPEAAVTGQDVGVLDDTRAFGLGDLTRPVRGGGIDDHDLVEQRDTAHHLPDRPADDRPDRLLLVERRQDEAYGHPLLFLEVGESAEIGKLGVVEVRFPEPPLDPSGNGSGLLGGPVGGGEGLGSGGELLEGPMRDRLAGLDDDDRRLGTQRDRLRQGAKQMGRAVAFRAGHGRSAHDDEIDALGLAQDRVSDVDGLAEPRLGAPADVLLDECRECPLGLRPNSERDPRRHEVERDNFALVQAGERVGKAQSELGVGSAADGHEDLLQLARATLLDNADVAGSIADHLVDGRREDRRVAVSPADRRLSLAAGGCLPAPAEDDEVRLLFRRRLDDPLRGVAADPDDGMDRCPFGSEVEHSLHLRHDVPTARFVASPPPWGSGSSRRAWWTRQVSPSPVSSLSGAQCTPSTHVRITC